MKNLEFKESLDKAVFTTKYVVVENSPIVYVSHDEEGDWQVFSSEEDIEIEDSMVVSLGEILEIDQSVEKILNLPINSNATRKSIISEWIVSKH